MLKTTVHVTGEHGFLWRRGAMLLLCGRLPNDKKITPISWYQGETSNIPEKKQPTLANFSCKQKEQQDRNKILRFQSKILQNMIKAD